MGKQVRLFMYGSDEIAFLSELAKIDNMVFLDTKANGVVTTDLEPNIPKSIFVTKAPVNIITRESGLLDQLLSNVIQFIRSKVNDKELWEGGLWVQTFYYDEKDNLVQKPHWLQDLYLKAEKWIKDNLKSNKDKTIYIGKEAYEMYKNKGFRLKNAPNVNIEFD